MLISLNWLKQHVHIPTKLEPEDLGLKLTMSTVEIESIKKQALALENIVVGVVLKVSKHPDASKLKLCDVDVGWDEPLRIVCGGINVKKGIKVVVAKPGAKVRWHGEGELVEIKKTKIRGADSEGMICAGNEIGLGALFSHLAENQIIDLSENKAKIGTPISDALEINDIIYGVDNKSMTHRPDLWGHYGMAREISAIYGFKLNDYNPPDIKPGKEIKLKVKVEDHDLCPRYMGVALNNIKITESPAWLKKRLLAVGLRPVNNIVDITNYVMYDLGQPMHAFDLKKLENGNGDVEIKVRKAETGESILSLDETKNELTDEMLVIADRGKSVAIAGVIGGDNTAVDEETTGVILEAANFEATSVRRTAAKLGLRTESSSRFEKGLDPNLTELALKKAVVLIKEICPKAQVASNIVDEAKFKFNSGSIRLELPFLAKKLGMELETKKVKKILKSLGFVVSTRGTSLFVKVPTWRAGKDVAIPEDLVEEVARIYGYDKIKPVLPVYSVIPPQRNRLREFERSVKMLAGMEYGFTEIYNYSFVSDKWLKKIQIEIDDHIKLANPIAKDKPLLRRSLFPNLLENVEFLLHANDQVRLFEIGKTFIMDLPGEAKDKNKEELLPRQDTCLGLVYADKKTAAPFFELSGVIAGLSRRFGIKFKLSGAPVDKKYVHPGRTADILVDGGKVGDIFELSPGIVEKLGMEGRVAFAELNLNELLDRRNGSLNEYVSPSQYPEVARDIAFIVDKKVMHSEIEETLLTVDPLLCRVELFDVYQGNNIAANKKSMAYHLHYGCRTKTLKSAEVDRAHNEVEKLLTEKFKAEIRK